MEIDPVVEPSNDAEPDLIWMNYEVSHTNARPVEPDLATAIKAVELHRHRENARARVFNVTWVGQVAAQSRPPLCLGAIADPASITDKSDGKPTKILVPFLTSTLEVDPQVCLEHSTKKDLAN